MSTPSPPDGMNPSLEPTQPAAVPHQPMDPSQSPGTRPLPGAYPFAPVPPPPMATPAPSAQEYLAMLNQNLRLTQSRMIYRDPQTLGKRPLPSTDPLEDENPKRKHKAGVDKAIDTMERRWQRDQQVVEDRLSLIQDDEKEVSQEEVDRLLQSISVEGQDAVGDLDQCVMVFSKTSLK
jgi:hypothetical protein